MVPFEGVIPVLRVHDLAVSLEYYTRALGFQSRWQQRDYFASVSRGRCELFLSVGDQGHAGSWVWIGVENVDALLLEYQASGARIRHLPTNYEWACEMQVEDPDGNVLRFGSDNKPDQPIGEWLDMSGERWKMLEDGSWTRA